MKRDLPGITHKMLTQQLRELERDGFLTRKVYAVVPPRVDYTITSSGKESLPLIESLRKLGLKWMDEAGVTARK
jgi:DNA-binding HxlR family transcriptional regulator